jgi:shikimate dehydrogenase
VKRFAVLGDPVAHSKSPAMHKAAYRALGLEHSYEAIQAKAADLAGLVRDLREGKYDGFNITIPHKAAILEHVDRVSESAAGVRVANTLVRTKNGEIVAHNTDVPALAAELKLLAPERTAEEWRASTAVVLGSGGAARAAVAALTTTLGVEDVVRKSRGESSLTPSARDATALTIVQATSAGMIGADPGDDIARAIDWSALSPRAVALDVIYAPPETPFLRAARAHGLRSANGLGMLARQGALAFELWLGVPAPYDVMLAALS